MDFFDIPTFVGSTPSHVTNKDTLVDIVFLDFIGDQVIKALNQIQTTKTYNAKTDLKDYTQILSNQVMGLYATKKWNP